MALSRRHAVLALALAGLPLALAVARSASGEALQEVPPQQVTSADGRVTLDIPPGALRRNVRIRIRKLTRPGAATGLGALALGAYELLPNGLRFAKPVTVTLRVGSRRSAATGVPAAFAALRSGKRWERLGSPSASIVDGALTLRGTIRHFTTLTAYEGTDGAKVRVTPSSAARDVGQSFVVRVELQTKSPQHYVLQTIWPRIPSHLTATPEAVPTRVSRTRGFRCNEEGFGGPDLVTQITLLPTAADARLPRYASGGRGTTITWGFPIVAECGRPDLRVSPIVATFLEGERLTRYEVIVQSDLRGKPAFQWKLTPPTADPACNNRGATTSTAEVFDWLHGDDHGCNHLVQGPRGHPGFVDLVVTHHGWTCRARYEGTVSSAPGLQADPAVCELTNDGD